jgi:endonuclease-3 related protein
MKTKKLEKIYNLLFDEFGKQHWWPADSPFEMVVGAVLTQNTAWSNVEQAIRNLKKSRKLTLSGIRKLTNDKLASLIRSAGYFNVKAKRLKAVVDFLREKGSDEEMKVFRRQETGRLRQELLGVKGVGPETADSILLYALNRPVFVVDAYTKRILSRHRLISEDATYEQIQGLFMDNLPRNRRLFNEYHALIVALGKDFCRPHPICSKCPLGCLFRGGIPKDLKAL